MQGGQAKSLVLVGDDGVTYGSAEKFISWR